VAAAHPGVDRVASAGRRRYLDWLRGAAVLIMIEGHTLDSWTLPADRTSRWYGWAIAIAGMGAPLFLFLAGVSVAFAAAGRAAQLGSDAAAAQTVRRRGWRIFLYAFLFRLQSFVLSAATAPLTLLKVDILNVMGPSIVAAATLWQSARGIAGRVLVLSATTVAIAMLTPILRVSPLVDVLPDPLQWYFRPVPGRTNFTLLPWSGFVTSGAAAGLLLQRATDPGRERRVIAGLAAAGLLLGAGGYAFSYLPPLYSSTNFWTSSPTFFFLRTGLLLMAVGVGWAWERRPWPTRGWSPLVLLGVDSLFVYWVHVELVYGVLTQPLHRQLPLSWVAPAYAVFTGLMLGLVLLKRRGREWWRARRAQAAAA
jgi:uncharacterized membrane protein